jgi:serine/threonine-protein kinase RsbW
MRTAIFAARFDQLDAIRKIATQAARDAGLDDSGIYGVELSMVEACTNIIEHAYEGLDGGKIECTCDLDDEKLTITIHDHGKSFDLSSVALPDLESDLESRPLGGLGVFFMKKSMDELRFESL